ncbi:Cofactor of BRCA1 (COBRA1) [Phytophthora infestans]|uniref:Cofactor of BRCA1 (COBRA1) n=1 Tax=Phytophthora infestans TaxID=4787 RepID=A0A833W266_PHYIN|nr:Cofactor of BRCA1 (COBRA1) [Phytophthora infestans]
MSEAASDAMKLRLKLKLPRSMSVSSVAEEAQKKLLIGARGGAAVKELLSTAPNIEVAIRDFQAAHGVAEAHAQLFVRKKETKRQEKPTTFEPVVQLLDLLQVPRSNMYHSLLEQMKKEMLLRIADLPQSELPRVLEQTFPYIEFRELRAIPIAVLARQEDTPELYLRELTENRRILAELPVHVRRKILLVDRRELQLLVEECTREYVTEQLEWYLNHPIPGSTTTHRSLSRRNSNTNMRTSNQNRKRSLEKSAGGSLWNVSSHVPSSADAVGSSSSASGFSGERRPSYAPDERRRDNPALIKLAEMLGDSESLYLSTLEIWRSYVVAANIPGSATNNHPKEYVDYVALLGAMRSDLANLQRDKTTPLLRTDPLHKFIWFLDRALKNQTLESAQLHELLGFIGRLRTSDLPANKKFRKKSGAEEEEESFEVVLGPPPVDELLAVLDKIAKIDARLIFAEPVPDDVPKYRDIIKDPMDLSMMRRKAKRGKYKTLEAFVADFNLMIRNCMTFNPDTTIFYKEGKRIGKRGNELIERNATALRGEPQRIRTKKRRKTGSGPTSEAISMLTSTGVMTIKDFGDVDLSGMIPEGLCNELLADVALVLSDPLVKQLICDALMKNLVVCWQEKELPTDNLICRALVQLLQIGNSSSVRRMIRKQDFVLRAPQVVTMRVVLPLLLRTMVGSRVYYAFPAGLQREVKTKATDDALSTMLWDSVLRASSAIRAMVKSFAVQCLVDHHIDAGSQLLHHLLLAEEESLLRDRVLLHAVAEVVLEQVKIAAASTSSSNGNDGGSNSAENGEVTMTLSEQLQALPIWKQIFDGFFVDVLGKRIQAAKESTGCVVHFADGVVEAVEEEQDSAVSGETASKKRKREHEVKSFITPVLHEKTVAVLSSLVAMIEKRGSAAGGDAIVTSYLKKTLGVLRTNCPSLEVFEVLWRSTVFSGCRQLYEPMLLKCPTVQKELFAVLSSDVKDEPVSVQKRKTDPANVDSKAQDDASNVTSSDTVTDAKPVDVGIKSEGGKGAATELGKSSAVGAEAAAGVETNGVVETKATAAVTDRNAEDLSKGVKVEEVQTPTEADNDDTKADTANNSSAIQVDTSAVNSTEEENNAAAVKAESVETDAESVTTAGENNRDDADVKMEDAEEAAEGELLMAKNSTGGADGGVSGESLPDVLATPTATAEHNESTEQRGEPSWLTPLLRLLPPVSIKSEGDVGNSDTQKEVPAAVTTAGENNRDDADVKMEDAEEAAEGELLTAKNSTGGADGGVSGESLPDVLATPTATAEHNESTEQRGEPSWLTRCYVCCHPSASKVKVIDDADVKMEDAEEAAEGEMLTAKNSTGGADGGVSGESLPDVLATPTATAEHNESTEQRGEPSWLTPLLRLLPPVSIKSEGDVGNSDTQKEVPAAVTTAGENNRDDADVKMEDAEEAAEGEMLTAKNSTGGADGGVSGESLSDVLATPTATVEHNESTEQRGEPSWLTSLLCLLPTASIKSEGDAGNSDTQKEVPAAVLPVKDQKDGNVETETVAEEEKEAFETQ